MTFFIGLCSIFFVNKMGEQNFISENALTAQLISSTNDHLVKHEINQIRNGLSGFSKEERILIMEKYFNEFGVEMFKQAFSFEENGKNYEGYIKLSLFW